MKIARLILRVTIGALFVGHGTQKLFGWFGGHGLEATAGAFDSMGMRPGRHHALAAGLAEAGGGAALAAGLATPLSSAVLTATMLTAIHRVHLKNGPWATSGGYEYNLVLVAGVLLFAEEGPGPVSIDAALGRERTGPEWGLFALGAGILGALGAHLYAAMHSQPAPAADVEPEPAPDAVGVASPNGA